MNRNREPKQNPRSRAHGANTDSGAASNRTSPGQPRSPDEAHFAPASSPQALPVEERRRANFDFERIQQLRAHEYVAEQIRRHIALRLVAPGDPLPSERDLTVIFGVGRPTVQHALRLLEAERLVKARRGRTGGTFVLEPRENTAAMQGLVDRLRGRRAELEELLEFRLIVEPSVARIAAEKRRNSDTEAIDQVLRSMERPLPEQEYMRLDTALHIGIAAMTRNRYLTEATERVRMELNDALSLLPETETWHSRLAREHRAILKAIEERDLGASELAARQHVEASNRSVRALLQAIDNPGKIRAIANPS